MIIDIHTHIFPDTLAPKAMAVLEKNCNYSYKPVTDMTANSLLKRMEEWSIDVSVVQPVITKPSQFYKINNWAKEISNGKLISFGGIYPHGENWKEELDYIASIGLKGIKLHPEYQNFYADDKEMLRIYDYAFSKGLIILFHGGFDPAVPPPFKSNPKMFAKIADEMKGGKMIIAHLGGHDMWDDVEKYLVGKEVYLDTSMGFNFYPTDQFLRIVKAHGAKKILFGSDSPWSNAKAEIEYLKKLPLKKEEIDDILGNNAKEIMGI